jgi:hypothetical protein
MRKLSFILLGVAAGASILLPAIAQSLSEDAAMILLIPLLLLVPLPIAIAVVLSIITLFRETPRTWLSYGAVSASLFALILFTYSAFPSVRNPVLQARAKAGSLQAQYDLGERYLHGIHILEDSTKGVYWLTRAAESGHLAAQLSLGDYYSTTRDREKARFWIERLANSKTYGWERLNAQSRLPSVLDNHPGGYFGTHSKAEIDKATQLLREAGISFQVKVGTSDPEKGWPGPFDLWVQGDRAKQAESVLASHSTPQKK